jgi:hypothetical protein
LRHIGAERFAIGGDDGEGEDSKQAHGGLFPSLA